MLSGYQAETIAYQTDGEIICRECAEAGNHDWGRPPYSEVALARVDRGLAPYGEIDPISRYDMDELAQSLAEDVAYDDGREIVDYDDIPGYPCSQCDREIS